MIILIGQITYPTTTQKLQKELVLCVELESSSQIGTDQSILCMYMSVPYLLCRGMG